MSEEANCIVCSQARAVVAVFPIARGYALKVYECSCCHSTLHLVTRMTKAALIKQHCETLLPVEKPLSSAGRRVQQRFAS
ncbi:hypothetical protein ACVI1J_000985 [Bradyrhizobium diazoefficiens]|jgi:hypothetical protein|nr:hypothetical protein [Bradyrhizobium japonicum]MBP1091392.1 hypothetical protein [Bradyrhizobium japonicum]